MQATLIYNPNAGGNGQVTPEQITGALRQAGYDPVYRATNSEDDLDHILADVSGLVVVAGGDGTVRAAATRLIGKKAPLALIPNGTANNIARALSISGEPLEIIAGLAQPIRRYLDVGSMRAPWGKDYFLEAAGFGLYAETLAAYRPEDGKSVSRSLEAVIKTVGNFKARHCRLVLDGEDISGTYLLVEALNTPAFGPRIKAAPEADPSDGLFEVVRVREDERAGFLSYLTGLLREELDELPNVEVSRGRKLEIRWNSFYLHVDAEVRPDKEPPPGDQKPDLGPSKGYESAGDMNICLEVLPQELEIWLPGTEANITGEPVRE